MTTGEQLRLSQLKANLIRNLHDCIDTLSVLHEELTSHIHEDMYSKLALSRFNNLTIEIRKMKQDVSALNLHTPQQTQGATDKC